MNGVLLAIGVVLAVTLAFVVLKARNTKSAEFDTFFSAVMDAANVGGNAYIAQVETISKGLGKSIEVSPRGLALARLLCALFPTAAFVLLDANDDLNQSVKENAPFSGKETWKLASGAALESLNIESSHPEFALIKSDTNHATQTYVDFFGITFTGVAENDILAARKHLAPQWERALELSVGETTNNSYSDQFCTSGLHTFVDWLRALSR